MQYELDRAPKQFAKQRSCESLGVELAPAIDHLLEQQLKVIRIGSADVGRSRIPRNLPRLEDFDVLGGDAEVALVSGCHYVWTDGAVAGNLAIPFSKPVLVTNQARYMFSSPSEFLNHLTVYQDANGHSVSLRQLLSMQVRERRTPYKEASFGRLHLVRNTPDELICVHNEMLSRLLGTYVESDEVLSIRKRFEETYRDFGQVAPRVSGEFLLRQRHLIQ